MLSQINLSTGSTIEKNLRRLLAAISEGPKIGLHCMSPPSINRLPIRFDSTLDLPFPHDILAPISTMRVPENTRQVLLRRLTARLQQLQKECSDIYVKACSSDFNSCEIAVAMRQACLNLYKDQCLVVQRRIVQAAKQLDRNGSEKKRTFNSEYIPLLETYFAHNAYPSALDRSVLARKSMMTPRQIEVWFQNHRNRAKKDGKTLPRLSSNLPLELSLASVAFVAPQGSPSTPEEISSDEDDEFLSLDTRLSEHPSSQDSFNFIRPPHAFPTTYSYHSSTHLSQNLHEKFTFSLPKWRRRPATAAPKSLPMNMDELIVMFASKLSFQEAFSKHNKRQDSDRRISLPWFAVTVTIPSSAPHPALLRISSTYPTALLDPVRTPNVTDDNLFLRGSSGPVTPGTPSLSTTIPKPPKLAPLPRRTPTPRLSNATLSLLGQTSNRASSFGSTTSSRRTSSSSLSSIDPITPQFSPLIQAQNAVLTDEHSKVLEGYINGRGSHHSKQLISLSADFPNVFVPNQTSPFIHSLTNSLMGSTHSILIESP